MRYEETARRLKKALSDKNMKAQELADKCNINKASISQYVNGTHKPSNIKAALMADVLEVSALWLMGFDLDVQPEAPLYNPRIQEFIDILPKLTDDQIDSLLRTARLFASHTDK